MVKESILSSKVGSMVGGGVAVVVYFDRVAVTLRPFSDKPGDRVRKNKPYIRRMFGLKLFLDFCKS